MKAQRSGAAFELPVGQLATRPAEYRGLSRDAVKLMVASSRSVTHQAFRDLPEVLSPGDVLVVNTSATMAAAIDGVRGDGRRQVVHLSTVLDDGSWVVELRLPHGPAMDGVAGEVIGLPGGLRVALQSSYPQLDAEVSRLWRVTASHPVEVADYLGRFGRPIAYDYLDSAYPLSVYQNAYSRQPDHGGMASAEMASAGRPFTAERWSG